MTITLAVLAILAAQTPDGAQPDRSIAVLEQTREVSCPLLGVGTNQDFAFVICGPEGLVYKFKPEAFLYSHPVCGTQGERPRPPAECASLLQSERLAFVRFAQARSDRDEAISLVYGAFDIDIEASIIAYSSE